MSTKLYIILDTNVLIHYLDVIKSFNEDIESQDSPIKIGIPSVLVSELDGYVICFDPQHKNSTHSFPTTPGRHRRLKRRDKIGWFASRASAWILAKVKERMTERIQVRVDVRVDVRAERHMHLRLLAVLRADARRGRRYQACRVHQRRCEPAEHGGEPEYG